MTKLETLTNDAAFREAVAGGAKLGRLVAIGAGLGAGKTSVVDARSRLQGGSVPIAHIPTVFAPPTQPSGVEWVLPGGGVKQAVAAKQAPAHGGKWKRFVAGFDIHGDKSDADALAVFFDFAENSWKPAIRICGGDVWDFRALRKGASAEEKTESMQADYLAGKAFLDRLFTGEGENYFTRGNHDERLWELAYSASGVERDFAAGKAGYIEDEMQRQNVTMLPYHKSKGLLQLGHLKVLHGFHCGVYASRQTALVYGSALFGHTHVIDQHAVPGMERRAARNCGCLCSTDMEYSSRQPNTLRQANGFAYGVLNSQNGEYHVWQAEGFGGSWMLPTDIVELG